MPPSWDDLERRAHNDVTVLRDKAATYGDSWRRRGGVDSFMMLARCWDRIEHWAALHNWNILSALAPHASSPQAAAVLDTTGDLRRYLLLVESYVCAGGSDEEGWGGGWDDGPLPWHELQLLRWRRDRRERGDLENKLPGELEGEVIE